MPPRMARWLLRLACATSDWQWLVAELETEYAVHILPGRGRKWANRWFWSQSLRSVWAMVPRNLRDGEWEYALLLILLAAAGPSVLMEAWWAYLLSLVPAKASFVRGPDFLVLSIAAHAVLGVAAGTLCTPKGLLLGIPAAWAFALLGQSAARSLTPPWFWAAALSILALSLAAGTWLRHLFDGSDGGGSHEMGQN
jgi:hypothetical protein